MAQRAAGAGRGRGLAVVGVERRSFLYRALVVWATRFDWSGSGSAIRKGPSGRSGTSGACRSKGLVAGEHPPDRLGELARDRDRGDRRAARARVAGALPGGELAV